MDKEVITKIIEAANHAPSGGNSQPWRFIVAGDSIKIVMLTENEHPILNFKTRGTYIAHGALLENIRVAARHFGYKALFSVFPEPTVSAIVTFRPSDKHSDIDLYDAVSKRHSNRKPYNTILLSEDTKNFVFHEADGFPQCRLSLIEGTSVGLVAESTALDIRINLENKRLHELFFKEVLWKEEDQHTRPGLYIKTMEAEPPKSSVMRLLGSWRVAQFFKKMTLIQKITEENAKTLASTGAFGAIIVTNDDHSFISAGRMIENIWLRATNAGLCLHLVAGFVFLWQQAQFGEQQIFSDKERKDIAEAYQKLGEIFQVRPGEVIAATFRIGEAPPPLAVSYKRSAEIDWR